jgi:RimJ/RimL family protein N-acetyltransferase
MRLVDVYAVPDHAKILYALLKERKPWMNINHSELPSLAKHQAFVKTKPYRGWFFVEVDGKHVGSILLDSRTGDHEIGVFIFKKYQKMGYAKEALKLLMDKYKTIKRFVCYINPKNIGSIAFFEKAGFKHIQNTYEYRQNS